MSAGNNTSKPVSHCPEKQTLPIYPISPTKAVDACMPSLTFMSQNLRGMGQGSRCKGLKLSPLSTHIDELDPKPDFVFVQEIQGSSNPIKLLELGLGEYRPFVGGIGALHKTNTKPAQGEYDTAILILRNKNIHFEHATQLHAASSSRQTLVCIKEWGLLLVNVHGPSVDGQERYDFFDALLLLLLCYKSKGWTIIIGGDFNIAPMANDRHKGTESDRSRNCIFQLCSQLNLIDIGAQLEPANLLTNGHLTFTTKPLAKAPDIDAEDIDRAKHLGYVSRVDLFLMPADLSERAAYSHRPTGCINTSFDHDQISLTIWNLYMLASMKASAAKAVPNAMSFLSGIHLDYGILDNSATIDKINLAFAGADIPDLLEYAGLLEPQPQPFVAYKKLLVKIREIIYTNWSNDFGLGVTDVAAVPNSGINMPLSRNTAAMDELFALHRGYLESLGTSPTAAMMAHTAAPIKQDEIDAACNRLVSHANPGPNGMPIKLFTSSEAARVVLCKLANYVLAKPTLVTKDFVSGCVFIPYDSSHPMSSQHVSHYNIEYRIITDVLTQRLSHALSPLISPEQSAALPGHHVRDSINTLMTAQHYLHIKGERGLFLFLDEVRVDGRFSFAIISQLLRNYCLPPTFIAAAGALFKSMPVGSLASSDRAEPFDRNASVFKDDQLSSILFIMAMELLRCSLHSKGLLHTAYINLPMGVMSHVFHGSSVVITASSSDHLPAISAALDLFSDATGIGFDLSKTQALSIGHNFSTMPCVDCPEFPFEPVADGGTISYLGTYFSNSNIVVASKRRSKGDGVEYSPLVNTRLCNLLTGAYRASRPFSDHHSRARAIDAYITPRLQHLIEFMPITLWTALNMAERLKGLIRGPVMQLPDAADEAELTACTGIYSFIDFDSTYYAVQLQQVHIAAMHFHRLAYPDRAAPPVPTWAKLLLYCWRDCILSRSDNHIPEPFKSMDIESLSFFFFEPFLQSDSRRHGRIPEIAWPLVWEKRIKALFTNGAHQLYKVQIAQQVDNARALSMPFFGTSLCSMTRYDWNVLSKAYHRRMPRPDKPITLASLPLLVASMVRLNSGDGLTTNNVTIRDSMVPRFDEIYNAARVHDEATCRNILNSSTTTDGQTSLTAKFDSAPAALHMAYGHPSYPEQLIPFTKWHDVPAVRAMLQDLPKISKSSKRKDMA